MSMLAALVRRYERLAAQGEAPVPGYSKEKIHFGIILSQKGEVVSVTPLGETVKGKHIPLTMTAPQPVKRTVGIAANLLWDKTAYVFGATDPAKESKRAAKKGLKPGEEEFSVFKARQHGVIGETEDAGLKAFLLFLDGWDPANYATLDHAAEMLDSNVVFRLDGLREKWLHDRPAAQALVARGVGSADAAAGLCLVTGEQAPIARLHPSIKGVRGAQSSGAAIVSFNQSSFASYGKEQGDNAPVSEFATFAYTTALNALLASNDHRVQIGDASVVFWAEPGEGEEEGAKAGESLFARMCSGEELAPDDKAVDEDLKSKLAGIAKGRASNDLRIRHDMPFYVLGLSPNAARISVRFWFETTLADLAKRLLQHFDDLWLEPAPWRKGKEPSVRSLVNQLAPMRIDRDGRLKIIFDQAPDHLIGELVRAVLSGSEYPYAILPMLLQRLKADRIVTGLRVALIKAVLARRERILRRGGDQVAEETKMVTDQFADDIGRKLGRLFALYEKAQDACFDELNSGLRDNYYASAMATPQYVFHAIDCNYQHHLSKMRKGRNLSDWIMKHKVHEYYKRYAGWLDREIGALNAEIGAFPMQLTNAQQGQFVIGYYQQKYERKTQQQDAESNQTASDEGTGELK